MDIVQLYLSPDLLDRVARECPGEGRSLVESTAQQDNVMATLLTMAHQSSNGISSLDGLYRQ